MDKQQKKTAIAISAIFAVIIIIMVLLIPIEKKNQRYEKFGKLAEVAETDERAEYIIEHYEEYPEYITDFFYRNTENLDYVYNYVFNKDSYANMSYTEDELNAEGVPALYMYDKRWAYERIGDTNWTIKSNGCAYTCLTMAYIGLTGNGDIDPVILANYSYYNELAGKVTSGLIMKNIGKVCEAMGLNGEYHNYDPDEGGTPIESVDEIAELLGDDKVLLVGMSGETFGNHGLIIRDIDGDTIYLNDPANEENTAKMWSFEDLKSEFIGVWVISNK